MNTAQALTDDDPSHAPAAIAEREEPAEHDRSLVRRACGGSRAAFETLVRRHQRPLYGFCFKLTRDEDAADELTQRAFIRAMEQLQHVRDAGHFRSWLLTIALNMARNDHRYRSKFVAVFEDETGVEPEAQSQLELAERSNALWRAVALLPPKQRMVVELRVYEERPFRQVADAMGISEGAAKVNFHHALRKLRASVPELLSCRDTP